MEVNLGVIILSPSSIGFDDASSVSSSSSSSPSCRCSFKVIPFHPVLSLVDDIPLELTERGTGSALIRLGKHFLSLSPIFEVFSTQIYTNSILNNLTFGGARYIATGRGFATTRLSFSILFSRFAGASIYLGMRTLIMLLYVTMSIWTPYLLYFWITVLALCIAPFVFNPHQFSFADFIIDYREFLRWMSRGNSRTHSNSWVGYCRLSRTAITGFKKKRLGHPSEKASPDFPRASLNNVFMSEIVAPVCLAIIFTSRFSQPLRVFAVLILSLRSRLHVRRIICC